MSSEKIPTKLIRRTRVIMEIIQEIGDRYLNHDDICVYFFNGEDFFNTLADNTFDRLYNTKIIDESEYNTDIYNYVKRIISDNGGRKYIKKFDKKCS
jgi:hypothetical protein